MIYAPLLIIFAAFLWALDGIVLRPSLYSLPVLLVVFIEHALALLFLSPIIIKELKNLKKLSLADWGAFTWIAVFGGVLGTIFITKALFYVNFINLSIVVLLQQLQPVFALTLAAVILKERLPKKFFYWAVLAIAGAYFVTFGLSVPNLDTGGKTLAAALFALGAAFAWGSSTVFGKRALRNASFALATYLRFALTTAIMFFVVVVTNNLSSVALQQITSQQWGTFFVIVFSSGAAAMLIYYYGLKRVKASASTIYELAFPLFAIMLEFAMHGRVLGAVQWAGAALLLFSIYKVSRLQRQNQPS